MNLSTFGRCLCTLAPLSVELVYIGRAAGGLGFGGTSWKGGMVVKVNKRGGGN
jgi:hypothetical protein